MAASDCQETSGSGAREEGEGKRSLRAVFGLDLRSLALFRIGLGVVLSCDLVQRIGDAESFYGDFGILPRSVLFSEFADPWYWTLHAFSGQSGAVALLFAVQLALALCLLAGYRTRPAALLCWLLVVSVQHRNEFVGHGGDQLLRTLLLWSLFLPLGARWSVDSALAGGDRSRLPPWLSAGTAALVLQTCFLYWSTLLLKWHPDWWQGRARRHGPRKRPVRPAGRHPAEGGRLAAAPSHLADHGVRVPRSVAAAAAALPGKAAAARRGNDGGAARRFRHLPEPGRLQRREHRLLAGLHPAPVSGSGCRP